MSLKGKKIIILAENFYQELELWYPRLRMMEEGAEVKIVAPEKGKTYTSRHGNPVESDLSSAEVKIEEVDAVIIPGGFAPDLLRRDPKMVEMVKRAYQQKKIIAAICHAGWLLISAGIVKGKKLTSFFSIKDDMINAGANWVDKEVVVDGNLITSRKPDDLPAFCKKIIQTLKG
ncbi:MAG: glutamine amidotransferase [candidate division Zixibacteria bacterium SM23_73_2]|nr:MAG: glutamine amidotransferase [candidate division Zixibacteria bacterium SM23_73_2]